MKYGYLKDGVVIATASAEGYAATDASVKKLWTQIPEAAVEGSRKSGNSWTHPEPEEPIRRTRVSPVEFKMLFTPTERLAIRAARSGETADPVIEDWFEILDDPRLTHVDLALPQTLEGLSYLVTAGIISAPRRAEIATGLPA